MLKKRAGFSWPQLSKLFNVTRGMAKYYGNGKHRISLSNFKKLCNHAGLDFSKFKLKFTEIRNKEKNPKFSKFNEDFAEFLGFLYGDGCLSRKGYTIHITCDGFSDFKYVTEVVGPKFINLFSLSPSIFSFKNCIRCRLYSKKVFNFLSNKLNIPAGRKKGKMKIPEIIYSNINYSQAFLRGLFDTDGGFHRHHKNSAQIHYTSYDSNFLKQVWELLLTLGFNAKLGEQDIWIFDSRQIDKFFLEINPHNAKHIYKYRAFKKSGIVPLHREINYKILNAVTGN
ncbi:MAG: LAGLIDADG family homing endonuclease [Candidatus Diapherotrites archaeon]